ncbi:MAG: glycosyltransferase involved in cell wall biosynthesis [Francisellaceae bacterium]|jgi:glycosyltransferase involved in cell wall biosynthesis
MKKILISSFDMEVGGVERSLLSMLNNFDYQQFDVDLFLYSQSGDFLSLLPAKTNLVPEVKEYKTLRLSIKEIISAKMWRIGLARVLAKIKVSVAKVAETDYLQAQYIWKYCLPFLPKNSTEYDVAISYLWPHHFVAEKVLAKKKIAWIHTDFSAITTEPNLDLPIWQKFDHIISISKDCTDAFIKTYPSLADKLVMVENITAPNFINEMSKEKIAKHVFAQDGFNLLSVGRLCHPKAFDKAIEVMHLIHQKGYQNIKWHIIGYGPDEKKLMELIEKHHLQNSFILLGKINNPYPYMKVCDLYVQPSRYEGKAVTVSEAKILGKPILVTNYPTAPSQIDHLIDGVICDTSIESIAHAIIDLYENPIQRKALSAYCKTQNYQNDHELNKLYKLMKVQTSAGT